MTIPITAAEAAEHFVASADGEYDDELCVFASAVMRTRGANVANVDMTLTGLGDQHQTKFKITIERTSAP